jgi:hypothetical protein
MRWFLSNVAGGAVRWCTFTIIAAITLLCGFAPANILADFIGQPPPWLIDARTRSLIVVIGVVALICIYFWDRRVKRTAAAGIPQPDWPIADAINYIVNDSKAILKQPRAPWIEKLGPHKGRQMVERGVEHEDARKQINEWLISGRLKIWGLRQIPVTHVANQFESTLREIKLEYWDRMQLELFPRNKDNATDGSNPRQTGGFAVDRTDG